MTEALNAAPPMPGLEPTAPPADGRAIARVALDIALKNLADEKAKVEHAKTAKVQAQAILDAAKPNIMRAEAAVTIAKANLLAFGAAPKDAGGDKVTFDQVIAILHVSTSQMTVEDIRAKLAEGGVNASADNLKAYMSRWAASGAVVKGEKNNRLEPARYYAPPAPVNGAPTVPTMPGTPLPEDFPGHDALVAAGYTTIESVPGDFDALFAIDGIGKATANSIVKELA